MEIPFTNPSPATLTVWKVKEGSFVLKNKPMFLYVPEGAPAANPPLRFDSPATGVVQKLIAQKGDVIQHGSVIVLLSECQHPTVMRDMCAECGQDLRKLEEAPSSGLASVSMIHTVPDLKVSLEQAHQLGKEEEKRLLRQRKLALLVDLDQTLIHTTNDNVPQNLEDVFHFQLVGHGGVWYHTRLRPLTNRFLENVSRNFELHICTFGTRNYAHTIAHQLDPNEKLFSHRILSREECFSQNSKTANLRDLFPHGDHMVCIIDDRDDVWSSAPNLVQVKPYHFFKHTGDIHAPPGLAKTELNPLGFEFTPLEVKQEPEAPSTSTPSPSAVNIRDISKDLDMSDDESDSEKEKKDEPDTSEAANEGDIEDEESRLGPPDPATPEKKSKSLDEDKNHQEEKPDGESDNVLENSTKKPEDNEAKAIEVKFDAPSSSTVVESSEAVPKGPEECDSTAEVMKKMKVEDSDDYLLYLEEILKGIHAAFYNLYDGMKSRGENTIPDVKNVIPYVRKKVLKGVRIVFSGVVPMQEKIETSRPYSIAIGLGAVVSNTIVTKGPEATTHLVAARPGTAKVNEARRAKGIHIVNPNWLWSCAERWEKVDEIVFPLKKSNIKRQPPPHCSAPELRTADSVPSSTTGAIGEKVAAGRKERTPSGRFMDTINPLLSFSMDEIEKMGNEVDDICNESDSSSSSSSSETFEPEPKPQPQPRKKKSRSSLSSNASILHTTSQSTLNKYIEKTSSSPNSDSGGDNDNSKTMDSSCDSEMFRNKRKCPERTETETETDEPLSSKFRRGEPLPSDLDCLNLTNEESDDDEGRDDGEDDWMARALEREFLEDSQESKEGLFE